MVTMLAPVVIAGEYGGYVTGILSLEQIRKDLDKGTAEHTSLYTLLDKNGNVIMSNRADQKILTPFARDIWMLKRIDNNISQWIPAVGNNVSIMERWCKSYYVAETPIGSLAEWKLVLEQPEAPFQKALYDDYTGKLTLLFLILLGALALAEWLSRSSIFTLEKLTQITRDLPVRLGKEGGEIVWPESAIKETNYLISNFQDMSESIQNHVVELSIINDSLEHRVEERTAEVASIMQELNIILDNAPIGIAKLVDRKQVWINRGLVELFLYSKEEQKFKTTKFIYPSDEAYEKLGSEAYPVLAKGDVFQSVQEMVRKDGIHIFVKFTGKAIDPKNLSKGTLWLSEDITKSRQAEDALLKSNLLLVKPKLLQNLPTLPNPNFWPT